MQKLRDVVNERCIRFWVALACRFFNLSRAFGRCAHAFNDQATRAINRRSPAQLRKMQQADDARLAAIKAGGR
ncbi:hypothetical protein AXE65_02695 [Ventosimonas gracilis]|uniref:Uncharacterized protein n=1 Tax=Ventosimonas gracilis TaxID=1680762 RepID=A0A139STM8_9GAMM|nr:hypothetical protein [Ventosimonas gracilis]KXU37933.1 hypothetical protein AXE65_02695 [Ventosimonas gracilis]